MGAQVSYHDPWVPETCQRKHDLGMKSVPLNVDSLGAFDAVLIATNHSNIDYGAIAAHGRLVVDTRNAMAPFATLMKDRLWKA